MDDSPLDAVGFRLTEIPDLANRSLEKSVYVGGEFSHFSSVFGANAVNDLYNFVVAQPLLI